MIFTVLFCLFILFSFYILLPWNIGVLTAIDDEDDEFNSWNYIRNMIIDAPIWMHIIPWLSVIMILFTNYLITHAIAFIWFLYMIVVVFGSLYTLVKYTMFRGWGEGVTLRSILDKRKKEK